MDAPRGKANVSSMNLSRELSMLSKASSIEYLTYIEVQSTNLNWANCYSMRVWTDFRVRVRTE